MQTRKISVFTLSEKGFSIDVQGVSMTGKRLPTGPTEFCCYLSDSDCKACLNCNGKGRPPRLLGIRYTAL